MNKSIVKILVVDDDTFTLNLFNRMLANLGFTTVFCADNGQAALERVGSPTDSPDLILLDIHMPEMDGIEFVRHLVRRRFAGGLIIISGEDERTLQAVEKLARSHKFNVLGHLQKPVSQERLAQMLAKWKPPTQEEPEAEKKIYGPDDVFLAIKGGELVNYYQPKVGISTRRVVGVETLVRWLHRRNGMVFPDQFIGVAEANGMIDDLTLIVLTGALAQAKLWNEEGLKLNVAVNMSMKSFHSLVLPELVEGLAAKAGVPPQMVELELTESSLMEDVRAPLDILTRLRLKRFRLSIDDFGTGHSSLAQLRDLPFDELKVDKSFVHGAWNDEKLRAICGSSLSLGKQLGMSVVAEGIEDKADWDFMRESGCDVAQGYYIARPMPANHLPGWIRSWEKSSEKVDK
ncbi:MAG: EAL domain-containing response regulator [Nitrospinae bacterium]|nr:EAL domain-containing response regulator [Nitrospinota bacterium]